MRVGWFGAEEGFYIRIEGTTMLVDRLDQKSAPQKRAAVGRAQIRGMMWSATRALTINPHRHSISYPQRRPSPLAGASRDNQKVGTHP